VGLFVFLPLLVLEFVINVVHRSQVSSVTDHVGNQDTTAKSADFDDDEGGLVSVQLNKNKNGFYRKFVIDISHCICMIILFCFVPVGLV